MPPSPLLCDNWILHCVLALLLILHPLSRAWLFDQDHYVMVGPWQG